MAAALADALADAHESVVTSDGRKEVKYAFAFKKNDWNSYHEHRPLYPPSMWRTWMDYHRSHGGQFSDAHDIGAGPGTAAKILAYFFPRVFVSDAGESNVATAARYLQPPQNYVFRQAPAEEEWLPPRSVDFASICMAMHYMDEDRAIRNVARSLRPGGTFAAVTYSFMLKFPGRPRLAELWFDVLANECDGFVHSGRLFPAAVKGCAKAMSGLDFVPLPNDLFEPGALRVQVNVEKDEEHPFLFVRPSPETFVLPPNRAGAADVVRHVRDEGWRRGCDTEWLKGFLVSCHLGFGEQTWKLEGWKELEAIIADAGGEVMVEWPVAMILATRRQDGAWPTASV